MHSFARAFVEWRNFGRIDENEVIGAARARITGVWWVEVMADTIRRGKRQLAPMKGIVGSVDEPAKPVEAFQPAVRVAGRMVETGEITEIEIPGNRIRIYCPPAKA
jgi:hypothetical protein